MSSHQGRFHNMRSRLAREAAMESAEHRDRRQDLAPVYDDQLGEEAFDLEGELLDLESVMTVADHEAHLARDSAELYSQLAEDVRQYREYEAELGSTWGRVTRPEEIWEDPSEWVGMGIVSRP